MLLPKKADTRNWQTLPHSIYYARLPLHEGENKINFGWRTSDRIADHPFTYQVKKGQTVFHTFSSLGGVLGITWEGLAEVSDGRAARGGAPGGCYG